MSSVGVSDGRLRRAAFEALYPTFVQRMEEITQTPVPAEATPTMVYLRCKALFDDRALLERALRGSVSREDVRLIDADLVDAGLATDTEITDTQLRQLQPVFAEVAAIFK